MAVYTCNICKAEYSHDKAYRHFLDCSWNQIKERRSAIHKPIDITSFHAGYGLRLSHTGPTIEPAVQRG